MKEQEKSFSEVREVIIQMKYSMFKLQFETGTARGKRPAGRQRDDDSRGHVIFRALSSGDPVRRGSAAFRIRQQDAARGRFWLSDAFPYDRTRCYIAKPMIERNFPDEKEQEAGNSERKKQDKKMKFIPLDAVEEYVGGALDAKEINRSLKEIGMRELRTQAAVRGEEETLPFHVGVYHFREGCGLYLIVGL